MKITVINNEASAGISVPCPDSTTVKPGQSKVMTGRTKEEALLLVSGFASATVIIRTELEANDREPLVAAMKADVDDSGAGAIAGVGFQLQSEDGTSKSLQPNMYIGLFDDAACLTPATNATLDTAAEGTIVSGGGTNLLKVTPSATGEISLTGTNAEDETVYAKAWAADGDYTIDSADTQAVVFSA